MKFPDREPSDSVFFEHGGRLAFARSRFPEAPEPWIDLSTGICPWSYPIPELSSACWNRLPDPLDLQTLLDAARIRYCVPPSAQIAAVAGSDLAISLIPHLVAPAADVAIVAPTYSSHGRAWTAGGHRSRTVAHPDEFRDHEIGVVVNPNNPDGRQWPPALLQATAARLGKGKGFMVVDEAFGEVTPELSMLARGTDLSHIVVLRSFGKFYGLAGLRLGFVATAHAIGAELIRATSDWPVSGPAIAVGCAALSDEDWGARTRVQLHATAARLDDMLRAGGLQIAGGTDLFRLARHADATRVFLQLARHGILVRPFSSRETLRFGLPDGDAPFARLQAALKGLLL